MMLVTVFELLDRPTLAPGFTVDVKKGQLKEIRRRLTEDFGYQSVESINLTPSGAVAYVHVRKK